MGIHSNLLFKFDRWLHFYRKIYFIFYFYSPLSKEALCVSKSHLNKLCRTDMNFDPLLFCLSCTSAHILFSLFFEAHSDLGVSGTEAFRIFWPREIYIF